MKKKHLFSNVSINEDEDTENENNENNTDTEDENNENNTDTEDENNTDEDTEDENNENNTDTEDENSENNENEDCENEDNENFLNVKMEESKKQMLDICLTINYCINIGIFDKNMVDHQNNTLRYYVELHREYGEKMLDDNYNFLTMNF
jgi:cobalamin biosynthesis protein CobT